MSLTVSSYNVCEPKVQHVFLERLVGAYELRFALIMKVNPRQPNATRWFALNGIRVRVRAGSTPPEHLGCAVPDQPTVVRQMDYVSDAYTTMNLVLQPHQLMKLEDIRDAQDLDFDLTLFGDGGVAEDPRYDGPVQDTLTTRLARSDWVSRLRDARALDILLLEVPMPIAGATSQQSKAVGHLRAAQKYFVEGHYKACVAECREVFDALGPTTGALKPMGTQADRDAMDKAQREAAMLSAIRHYTHPAHHSATQVVAADYKRAEAKLLLHLTAACVSDGNGA